MKKFLVVFLIAGLVGCTGGESGSPSPTENQPSPDDNVPTPKEFVGTYQYPELAVGDGTVEVSAISVIKCTDNNGQDSELTKCPLSQAPKVTKQSPSGTYDLGYISGSLGKQRFIPVNEGETIQNAMNSKFKCSAWRGFTKNVAGDFCDEMFSFGSSGTASVFAADFQDDGKIIVAGDFEFYHGTMAGRIVRLNIDGTVDDSFQAGAGFDDHVFSVKFYSANGKKRIIVGGAFTSYKGVSVKKLVALKMDGSLDETFSTSSVVDGIYNINSIAIQSDGKVVAGGDYNVKNGKNKNFVVRLNADGSSDDFFNVKYPGGSFGLDEAGHVFSIAIQRVNLEERILISGYFTKFSTNESFAHIKRLKSNGDVDTSFNPGVGFNNIVRALAVQSDGKIVAGGDFDNISGHAKTYLARLEADGTFDSSFNYDSYSGILMGFNSITAGYVSGLSIQEDGKILVAGNFQSYNQLDSIDNGLIRLNTDGSKDLSFDSGVGFNNPKRGSGVISIGTGESLVAIFYGAFMNYKTEARKNIVSLKDNGTEW